MLQELGAGEAGQFLSLPIFCSKISKSESSKDEPAAKSIHIVFLLLQSGPVSAGGRGTRTSYRGKSQVMVEDWIGINKIGGGSGSNL